MEKKKELFSYSKLTTYNTCPYSYYLTYICKEERKQNIYSFLGTVIHELLEKLQVGEIDNEYAVSVFEKKFKLADFLGYEFPTKKSGENFKECIMSYFKNYKKIENVDSYIEEYIELDIEGITIRGYIDLYTISEDKYIDVYDYKSSSKFSKKTLKEKQMQLVIYGLALKEKYPDKIIRSLNFDMCKYTLNERGTLIERNKAEEQENKAIVSVEFSEENIREAREFVKETYNKIKENNIFIAEDWEPSVNNFFCRNLCSNYNVCTYASK